jgi:hypothetical protein
LNKALIHGQKIGIPNSENENKKDMKHRLKEASADRSAWNSIVEKWISKFVNGVKSQLLRKTKEERILNMMDTTAEVFSMTNGINPYWTLMVNGLTVRKSVGIIVQFYN